MGKKVKFVDNIGTDVMISGQFYELLISYWLVKIDLDVIVAHSVAFDLLVIDKKNKIFNNKKVGISVKGREQKNNFSISLKQLKTDLFEKQAKLWGFKPYYCFVTLNKIIIVPLNIVMNHRFLTDKKSFSLARLIKYHNYKDNIKIINWKYPVI